MSDERRTDPPPTMEDRLHAIELSIGELTRTVNELAGYVRGHLAESEQLRARMQRAEHQINAVHDATAPAPIFGDNGAE